MVNKYKTITLFFLLILLFVGFIQAQDTTVNGTVTDSETEEPLPGVNIAVEGTTVGTTTDTEGRFELNVPSQNDTLRFSFVGYQTQEIGLAGRTELGNIVMQPTTFQAEEMVVVGYGTQQKSDLTGSVESISKEDFNTSGSVSNVAQSLQGRAAGVSVKQNSSAPGGSMDIRIRGNNSISSSNEPLYVVDGFPTSEGMNIDPSQVKSVEILKDASATAIYGSRGANGVVLITTKRGQAGESTITYNGKMSIQDIKVPFDLLGGQQYMQLANNLYQEIEGQGNQEYGEYTPSQLESNVNTNWIDAATRRGKVQKHELQFSGGNESTQVFSSLGVFGQEGVLKNTTFDQFSGRINVDHKVNDYISADASIMGQRQTSNFQNYGGNLFNSNVMYSVLTYDPTVPVYNNDGSFARPPGGRGDNPVANLIARQNDFQKDRFVGDMSLRITEPVPGLEIAINPGAEILYGKTGTYLPRSTYQGSIDNGVATQSDYSLSHYLIDATATYDRDINEHHSVTLLGGYSYEYFTNERSGVNTYGYSTDAYGYHNLGAASNIGGVSSDVSGGVSSSKSEHLLSSVFGRVNYSYDNKYLFTFTLRRDGSSRFGEDNRWGTFPSGSLAWRISQEPFMEDADLISNLKLRAGYGVTGNERIGNYTSFGLVNIGSVTFNGNSNVSGTYLNASSPPNSDLKWETTSQYNVGIDLGLLENRLSITMDAYYKKTSDLLINVNLPLYTGYSSGLRNIGEVENKGFEFSLNSQNFVSPFSWETNLNFSINRNTVLDIGDEENILLSSSKPFGSVSEEDFAIIKEGEPLGSLYGYVYNGVIQQGENYAPQPNAQAGDPKFKDVNGDGSITAADRSIIGSAYPDFTFGMTNSFAYKNFNLSIAVYGSLGNDLLNMNRMNLEWKRTEDALNRWTPDNTDTNIPRNGFYYSQYGGYINSHFIEDASYLRLQNVTLGYNLPIETNTFKTFRIYAMAENLLTMTDYTGWNPEVDTKGYENNPLQSFGGGGGSQLANAGAGLDFNSYPSMRTFTLGLQISL